jgi:hypothetical protein
MSYAYRQFPESKVVKSVSLRTSENGANNILHVKIRSTGNVYEYRMGSKRTENFVNEAFWGGNILKAFKTATKGLQSTLVA